MINIRENRGITIITLILAIVIMLIISSIILYNAKTGISTRNLNNMYNDIRILKDKVDIYYSTYGKIPTIGQGYSNVPNEILTINPNDNNNYYVIDLESLENLTLNFGKGYMSYKQQQTEDENDIYIINEQSHNIYYVKGIILDEKKYYTVPGEYNKIDIPSVNHISVKGINKNIATLEINAINKNDNVQAVKVYMNDNLYKTYLYTEQKKQTVIEVLDVILPFYNDTTFYIQAINEKGEQSNSDKITLKNEEVIATLDDMKNFANAVNGGETFDNKTIKLISDINLNCNEDNQWVPIGTDTVHFKGTFDGKNHEIKNLYINNSSNNQALFCYIDKEAKIKNLTISGSMTSSIQQGGVASVNYGIIENCTNNVNLNANGTNCGGIVANNVGIIYKCINNGKIISKDQAVGGIVGTNGRVRSKTGVLSGGTGLIIECINKGDVSASSYNCGGIAGTNGDYTSDAIGYICNSYNIGKISGGQNNRAGIVGTVDIGKSYLYNCYNRGDISGCPDIIGYNGERGTSINLNSYGVSEATTEKLNVESDIQQVLRDTNLYRSNAWILKDGVIALDWE